MAIHALDDTCSIWLALNSPNMSCMFFYFTYSKDSGFTIVLSILLLCPPVTYKEQIEAIVFGTAKRKSVMHLPFGNWSQTQLHKIMTREQPTNIYRNSLSEYTEGGDKTSQYSYLFELGPPQLGLPISDPYLIPKTFEAKGSSGTA